GAGLVGRDQHGGQGQHPAGHGQLDGQRADPQPGGQQVGQPVQDEAGQVDRDDGRRPVLLDDADADRDQEQREEDRDDGTEPAPAGGAAQAPVQAPIGGADPPGGLPGGSVAACHGGHPTYTRA